MKFQIIRTQQGRYKWVALKCDDDGSNYTSTFSYATPDEAKAMAIRWKKARLNTEAVVEEFEL